MLSKLSLRNRFILGFVLIAAPLSVGISLAARQIMVTALEASLDSAMQHRAEFVRDEILTRSLTSAVEYELRVERLTEDELPDLPRMLRIAGLNGVVLASFGTIPDSLMPQLDGELTAVSRQGRRFSSVRIANTRAMRVYTMPVNNPATGETMADIQTANSLAAIIHAQTRLLWTSLGIAAGGAAAGALAGYFFVSRSLTSLDRILSRVSKVEAGEQSLRLPEERRPPELQELADSLNGMWDRLQNAVATRDEFVASVSHDLRTPFTAIRGQVDVMLLDPGLDDEGRQSLERMQREITRLIRLSNNLLLDVQLDRAPELGNEQVNVRELVEDVVLEMRHVAADHTLNIRAQRDVTVLGDYDLLKQSVINLVDNAIKFTPPGESIQVSLLLEDSCGIIRVEDTGPGMSQETIASVDTPFKMSSARSGKSGAGLGLSIVSKVTRAHGGTVEISNRQNGRSGARVDIRLPLYPGTEILPTSGSHEARER